VASFLVIFLSSREKLGSTDESISSVPKPTAASLPAENPKYVEFPSNSALRPLLDGYKQKK
jgi:hypothetical protein